MSPESAVPVDALSGVTVGLSVSDSMDLARLGLAPAHCELAVSEISRAIIMAGGKLTYGGRIRPAGYSQLLMDEVRRFGDGRGALTIVLAETEHKDLTVEELRGIDRRLGTSGQIILLSASGERVAPRDRVASPGRMANADPHTTLSAMRLYITARTDARVVLGGRLSGFHGKMPGIVEESLLSMQARKPLYVAGGFGGAAAAVARALGRDTQDWAFAGFPSGAEDSSVKQALLRLTETNRRVSPPPNDGLSTKERMQLAAAHRAGDIATLVVKGLSRARAAE